MDSLVLTIPDRPSKRKTSKLYLIQMKYAMTYHLKQSNIQPRISPQVQISLAEWNQIKGEFQMVCFAGIMAGNNRQSVDSKILAGMNDIGKEVYLSAYRSGSEYPKLRSKTTQKK